MAHKRPPPENHGLRGLTGVQEAGGFYTDHCPEVFRGPSWIEATGQGCLSAIWNGGKSFWRPVYMTLFEEEIGAYVALELHLLPILRYLTRSKPSILS